MSPRPLGTTTWAAVDAAVPPLAGVLFLAAFVHAIWVLGIGWGNGIYDAYGFRQAQTAFSTYYMLHGSPLLAYETPVFGYPWSLPFEFPLYQWLVAGVVVLSGAPLEQAGRLVNAAFYLASLGPAWIILRGLRLSPASAMLCLAILLASPFYLFWSRTFMIESTALFLSLCYLAAVVRWRRRPSVVSLAGGSIFGALAALVKMTTFVGFAAAAGLLVAIEAWRTRAWRRGQVLRAYAPAFVAFALLPYLAGDRWVAYGDALKLQNPLTATYLTSDHLQFWVFGDWPQRMNMKTWTTIWARHADWVGHWLVLAVALAAFPFSRGGRGMALAALGLACGVFLVFTNLHFVHDYYQYSNVVFVLAAVGLLLAALVDAGGWRRVAGLFLFAVVLAIMMRGHGYRYLARQTADRHPYDDFARRIAAVTAPEDVVAIWGRDWSPELPFAARRRALMFIPFFDPRNPRPVIPSMLEALHAQSYEVTALVFCANTREEAFVRSRLEFFDDFVRVYRDDTCDLYARKGRGALHANPDEGIRSPHPGPLPAERGPVNSDAALQGLLSRRERNTVRGYDDPAPASLWP